MPPKSGFPAALARRILSAMHSPSTRRLGGAAERLSTLLRRGRSSDGLGAALGPTRRVIDRARLPDGTLVDRIVVGAHGLAVVEDAPVDRAIRHRDGRWEARLGDRGWTLVESPLDRAARHAERVRRWLAIGDRDFVVKVHAAIVTPDRTVQRSASCAVLAPDQVVAWIDGLPAQRSLTPGRRDELAGTIARLS